MLSGAIFGAVHCGFDNNQCAEHGSPHRYVGRAFTADGRPDAHARIEFQFSATGYARTVVADVNGGYCLIWPVEQERAFITAVGGAPSGPVNAQVAQLARFVKGRVIISPDGMEWAKADPSLGLKAAWEDGFASWEGGPGGIFAAGPKVAALGSPRCARGAPPWHDYDNATANWRFWLGEGGAFAGVILAIVAACASAFVPATTRRLSRAALRVAGASLVVFVTLWILP